MSEEKKNYVFIGGRMQGKTRDLINQLIEENKHLQQKVEQLEKENKELKQPQVFIDCENMEERYGRDLYEDYLKEKIEQLENIIDVKKYDCDYLETLFSKSSKEDVLKAYTYKCEQLEKVMKARNEFEMKAMQLENIRKEAIEATKDVKQFVYDELVDRNVSGATETHCKIMDLLNILNKGE